MNTARAASAVFMSLCTGMACGTPAEMDSYDRVIESADKYAAAISCPVRGIVRDDIVPLVPYTAGENFQDQYWEVQYLVFWNGDLGCHGGSGSEQTHIAMVTVATGQTFIVDPLRSSPVITFPMPVRFVEKVVDHTKNTVVLEGHEYGPEDADCCPTMPVRFTMKMDNNGRWKMTEKISLATVRNSNLYDDAFGDFEALFVERERKLPGSELKRLVCRTRAEPGSVRYAREYGDICTDMRTGSAKVMFMSHNNVTTLVRDSTRSVEDESSRVTFVEQCVKSQMDHLFNSVRREFDSLSEEQQRRGALSCWSTGLENKGISESHYTAERERLENKSISAVQSLRLCTEAITTVGRDQLLSRATVLESTMTGIPWAGRILGHNGRKVMCTWEKDHWNLYNSDLASAERDKGFKMEEVDIIRAVLGAQGYTTDHCDPRRQTIWELTRSRNPVHEYDFYCFKTNAPKEVLPDILDVAMPKWISDHDVTGENPMVVRWTGILDSQGNPEFRMNMYARRLALRSGERGKEQISVTISSTESGRASPASESEVAFDVRRMPL